jgi:hypothetical protein
VEEDIGKYLACNDFTNREQPVFLRASCQMGFSTDYRTFDLGMLSLEVTPICKFCRNCNIMRQWFIFGFNSVEFQGETNCILACSLLQRKGMEEGNLAGCRFSNQISLKYGMSRSFSIISSFSF